MALDTAQLQLIELRVANDGPNPVATYLLCFSTGIFGGHRFYLGHTGSGLAMLLLSMTVFGLIVTLPWLLIDLLFLTSGMIREGRDAVRSALMTQMMANPTSSSALMVAH
jgi:TM2 domain-containing membrane protein YozV